MPPPPFPDGRKRCAYLKDDITKTTIYKGREKYTNWFQFGDLVKEAASSRYFKYEAYLKVQLETRDL